MHLTSFEYFKSLVGKLLLPNRNTSNIFILSVAVTDTKYVSITYLQDNKIVHISFFFVKDSQYDLSGMASDFWKEV